MNNPYEINISTKNETRELFPEILKWYENNNTDTIIIVWNNKDEIVYATKSISLFTRDKSIFYTHWYNYFPQKIVTKIKNHFFLSNEQLLLPNVKNTCYGSSELFIQDYKCIVDQFNFNDEVFFICKLKEITDLNHLKDIIIDSEKLLSAAEFSAGIVHEIRNPLTSLKGFIQLVQAGVKQKEKYYEVMIDEVEKLEKITSELLHMAKPFSNNFTTVLVAEIIKDVLFIMNTQSIMKDINIILNLEENLKIYCNASQIKQVFINLIKNGSEAMKMKGNLHINSYEKDDMNVIEVIDQGEGIPQEKIRELKKPFYTTKSDGTGLGLMITQHILDIHQGELEVFSRLNQKTIFRVKLPVLKGD